MNEPVLLLPEWMPADYPERLMAAFPDAAIIDARDPAVFDRYWPRAVIACGPVPAGRLADAPHLRWVQLLSAGVPAPFCAAALKRGLTVTNLSGLYGTAIAEHALALMLMLSRHLNLAMRNQVAARWDKGIAQGMRDLHGRTVALVGLGNIGQEIARLTRALGMRVLGCRRNDGNVPGIDRIYPLSELHAMLAETDVLVITAPLTAHTEGLMGAAEFAALKPGAIFINVSRGAVAREEALLEALRLGRIAGAGLDAYATEPLPADHPFWSMPQVVVSPHVSGDSVNYTARPMERFARNLHLWGAGQPLEGLVDLQWGY